MFNAFRWSEASLPRVHVLQRYEAIQPYVKLELARRLGIDMMLDIGANVGGYSLMMAGLDGVHDLIAFEPAPATRRELAANLALNGFAERVEISPVALSRQAGTVRFAMNGSISGQNGVLDTWNQKGDGGHEVIEVATDTLDAVLVGRPGGAPEGRRIAVKLDVEGHEAEVLAGSKATFAANGILLQVEMHEGHETLRACLDEFGLSYLCHIGPDYYFSSLPETVSERMMLDVFEAAMPEALGAIWAGIAQPEAERRPIRRRVLPELEIELGRSASAWLRRARARLRGGS